MKKFKYRVEVNAPATLVFVMLCVIVYGLSVITKDHSDKLLFSVYGSKLTNILTYPRFFGHVLGHISWRRRPKVPDTIKFPLDFPFKYWTEYSEK